MPLPEPQLRECLSAVGSFIQRRRPPPKLRAQLDYRANIKGSEVVLVEVRPAYNDKRRTIEHAIAKAKWIGSRKVWRLFWMRADMKWHSYQPMPEARTFKAVMTEVERDLHCCFFG